jgi:hypothetical protein
MIHDELKVNGCRIYVHNSNQKVGTLVFTIITIVQIKIIKIAGIIIIRTGAPSRITELNQLWWPRGGYVFLALYIKSWKMCVAVTHTCIYVLFIFC